LLWAAVLLAAAAPSVAASPTPAGGAEAHAKPNFIVILTDDLDTKSAEFMPRLTALLAKPGTTFTNYFVTDSLCCPSRASLLRGQYPHNHQVLSNHPPEGSFEKFYKLGEEQSTIATWLQAAGYRTVLLGKYLNAYIGKEPVDAPSRWDGWYERVKDYVEGKPLYVPPGWDEWYASINHHTKYFHYQLNENGRAVSYGRGAHEYETDVLAAKTVDFIARTGAKGKQPFFIYLAPAAPHTPAVPAPRHAEEFPRATAPETASFNEANLSGKPAWLQAKPLLSAEDILDIDRLYRRRLQSMLAVDEMIEKIVDALRAHGLLDHTYIFFTSDNGFHLGEHRLKLGKATAYEEDIRVPLIVRGPGVPAGKTLPHLALNIDLAPTLAELAGIAAPGFVDGRSLGPVLTSAPPSPHAWRDDFLVEFWPHRPGYAAVHDPGYVALRTRDHLYVEYGTGERELYDLRVDPDELHNVVNAVNPGVLAQLSKRVSELKHCAAETCRHGTAGLL
jgi:arylsulfatase A-like enzyme